MFSFAIVFVVVLGAFGAPDSHAASTEVVVLKRQLAQANARWRAEWRRRIAAQRSLAYVRGQLAVAITERDAARSDLATTSSTLTTTTAQRDAAIENAAAATAALVQDVQQQVAMLSNADLWSVIVSVSQAFETVCYWSDTYYSSATLQSYTFDKSAYCL